MDKNDVFVLRGPSQSVPTEYYRNMMPDVPIVLCTECNHFFHEEDWEFAVMQKGVRLQLTLNRFVPIKVENPAHFVTGVHFCLLHACCLLASRV